LFIMTDFERIEKAILFIKDNFKLQPELDEVARQVHLSPFHFQRMFKEWAGVSPKKFLQFISVEFAKNLLNNNYTLAATSFETGLSGTSRLHDLFLSIEAMTPGEYKNEGAGIQINYQFENTAFGEVIIASTKKGICHIAFTDGQEEAITGLINNFSKAGFRRFSDPMHREAIQAFQAGSTNLSQFKLHLKGTPFQVKVWRALLRIPAGSLASYGQIASAIGLPRASRAVGMAISKNPVAYLIPCHRVIKSTGVLGEYHWGHARKTAMIGWEAARWEPESGVEENC
jgi:AraC family transcriptional regulator, regulatory protein of adaptative response / methylated-DNA-[protein]-cysteine methyltransferase